MSIDQNLLDILCCPVSKTPVTRLSRNQLQALNHYIDNGQVVAVEGAPVQTPLQEALVTLDGKVIYPIEDGIPVMLPESGIGTAQFERFPQA